MRLGIIAGVVVLAAAVAGCSGGGSPSSGQSSPAKPHLVVYGGQQGLGVQIGKQSDLAKLTGAPADFKAFMARQLAQLIAAEKKDKCHAAVGLTVDRVRTDGYARGDVNECGGYAALWAKVNGSWRQIVGTQDVWHCPVLERYGVPSSVAGGQCYQPGKTKLQHYDHA